MSGKAWRFRQCPECSTVNAAGDLHNLEIGSHWTDGSAPTQCPSCGFTGVRSDFRVVRDAREKPDQCPLCHQDKDGHVHGVCLTCHKRATSLYHDGSPRFPPSCHHEPITLVSMVRLCLAAA